MPCSIEAGYAGINKKVGCGNMINMLNVSDQIELTFCAVQTRRSISRLQTIGDGANDDGGKKIGGSCAGETGWQNPRPASADARIFAFAADVAVARA
jgi:hypothetical protein